MLNVGFHATNGKELEIDAGNREGNGYDYVEIALNKDLTLFLSPENATQLAKALLSQVQQIEEKELANHE